MPSANDVFNIDIIGSISLSMLDFRIEVGMLFGPVALETEQMPDTRFFISNSIFGSNPEVAKQNQICKTEVA